MKKYIFMSIFLGVGQLLFAQFVKKDTLDYKFSEEIVITSTRINMQLKEAPFSISIVGPENLDRMARTLSVDEPMKLIPGVKVDNQANGNRVHLSMRGQGILSERGIRGIRVLVDGIPVNDPAGFAPDLFDVDWGNVEKIEVLRGPSASLYGGSASGGIINVSTKDAPNVPLFGEVYAIAGSNNFWKGAGRFGGNVNKINYSVSFSRAAGDGFREHTHFWGNNLYAKAVYTPSDNVKLTPVFSWTDFYHENPEGINLDQYKIDPKQANPDAIPFNEFLETNRVTNGITGLIGLNENQNIQFSAFVKRTLFTEANNHTFNRRIIVTPGSTLQYTLNSGNESSEISNSASIGADFQWQTIDEARTVNDHTNEGYIHLSDETMKQRNIGLFFIDKISPVKNLTLVLSIRYDQLKNELSDNLPDSLDFSGSNDFSKATGRIGASYSLCSAVNLFADWGQGFLPPAIEELAQNPENFSGFNASLSAATSNGFDIGLRGNIKSLLYYDVTGFYMKTENDFDRYRITNPLRNQETFYRNAAASKRFGLELYAAYFPLKNLKVQGAYTFSSFKYSISSPIRIVMDDPAVIKYIQDGNMLPNSPEHQLMLDIAYYPIPSLCVQLNSETYSKSFIDGANIESEAVEGYTLFGARVSYDWSFAGYSGELSFSLKNIGDKKYVAYSEPDPGGNAYQPGAGREFFGGIKIRL